MKFPWHWVANRRYGRLAVCATTFIVRAHGLEAVAALHEQALQKKDRAERIGSALALRRTVICFYGYPER
jgi:hypothetical protein